MSKEVFIAGATRTPTGRFLGAFSSLTAPELGAVVISEALKRSGVDKKDVDEVIMGNVVSAGIGQAPARQAAIKAGIPPEASALTINKVCGSGLKAVMLAAQAIKVGDAEAIIAGGMESMSTVPYLNKSLRTGARMGNVNVIDAVVHDGLWCAFANAHMGVLAEFTADNSGITREELDKFSYESQMKAVEAIKSGAFAEEIVPVIIKGKKGEETKVEVDETPRADTTISALAKLKPAFKPDGKITPGNAPGLSDGASAVVVCSEEYAKKKSLNPLARITAYAVAGREPKYLFYAPVDAVKKIMAKLNCDIKYFDLIEINEAFSSQVLADGKELGFDWTKVNVHGGAIALGHPIGASGARVLTTLIYALRRRKQKKGLATLCLGGGNAVAMSIEIV